MAKWKRSRLRRGPWRRKKNRPPRPGKTTPPPSNAAWRKLCREIRIRDLHTCRRCGQMALGGEGHIDHLIPRRLCASLEEANHPFNLALLCNTCHAFKTQTLEPGLYRADVGSFAQFIFRLGEPQPSNAMIAYAYSRIAQEMRR